MVGSDGIVGIPVPGTAGVSVVPPTGSPSGKVRDVSPSTTAPTPEAVGNMLGFSGLSAVLVVKTD